MSKDRFKILYQKGVVLRHVVIVDSETGVNYLFVCEGSAGGLTVLLDKDGKPLVTPVEE
ncbi:DUF6440 family protein [Clostridium sp. C8-1-8]|uniref:DUF6440 family protein n=1 Tax=Clostridium sp. C8-1-8 TaxID=2698831 RepID=UPI00192386E3|nr:DUF6440 family protein [Clostridium sp. C8-1-8]